MTDKPEYLVVTDPDGLWIGAARAYHCGDLILKESAVENGWAEQCAARTTKAAAAATAAAES